MKTDPWVNIQRLKMTPVSILNPDQYSSLHRPCVICEKLTGFLGLFSEPGRCKIPLKLVWNSRHVWMSSFRAPLPVTALAKKLSFPAILSQRSYDNCSLTNMVLKNTTNVVDPWALSELSGTPISAHRLLTKCVEQYLTMDGIWCSYKKFNHLNSDAWCLILIALRRAISKNLHKQIFCIILSIQIATFCQYSLLPWSKLLIIQCQG